MLSINTPHFLNSGVNFKIMEKRIEIWYDQNAENPFEAWDCEPELMYETGRHSMRTDCSKGNIISEIRTKATEGMVKRHIKTICNDILNIDLDWCENFDQKHDEVWSAIGSASLKELGKLCELFKIPYIQYTSTGYSQGDWSNVLIVCTDQFFESSGCQRKNAEEILKGSKELFDAWAWGDVFGFTEFTKKEFVKIPREEYNAGNFDNLEDLVEWEETNSCGGFYGDDFENNGILDEVSEELREAVKNYDKCKIKY